MPERTGSPAVILAAIAGVVIVLGVLFVVVIPRWGALSAHSTSVPDPSWASPAAQAPSADPTGVPGTTPDVRALVDADWATRMATATGIPDQAVLAYAGAALQKAATSPRCRLSWTTLAAIGDVESDNGQHGGSSIGPDGTVSPPIFGVALNGGGVALIPDSDGGSIDGDATADRAVGPMQLIPQTWRSWHTDGNGDGVEDPQNIDDASVATANYLCRASSALDTEAGWRAAVSAYNSADSYIGKVAGVAIAYNQRAAEAAR